MDIYLENQWSAILTDISITDLLYTQRMNDLGLSIYREDSDYESFKIIEEASVENDKASKNILIRILDWFKKILKKIGENISNIFKKISNNGDDNDDVPVPKDTEKHITTIEKFHNSIQGLITKVKRFDWVGAFKVLLKLAKPALKIAITVGTVILVKRAVVKRWLNFLDNSKKKINDSIPDLSKAKDIVGNKIVECISPIKDVATAVNDVTDSITETVGKGIDNVQKRVDNIKQGYVDLATSVVGENNPRLINNALKKSIGHRLSNGGAYAINKETNQLLFKKDAQSNWSKVNPRTIISNLSSADDVKRFDKFIEKNNPDLKTWSTKNLLGYIQNKFK